MRDIKFRAWNGDRMIFNGPGGFCDFEIHGGAVFEWDSTGYEIHEKDYPLMQFTGLKDKNGQDIYEGDTVHENGFTGIVYYNNDEACFAAKSIIEGDDEAWLSNTCELLENNNER